MNNDVKTPPERTVFDKTFLKDVYLRLTHFKVTIGRVALNVTALLRVQRKSFLQLAIWAS